MASVNLPVIVLVPGAFGTAAGFEKLVPHLEKVGFSTHPGTYPSCNPSDPAVATCQNDIASLRNNVLLPLLEQEQKDVVIIAHSYGGVVAGAAAKYLDKQTRRTQGQAGGSVVGLIYVVGNITLEDESLLEAPSKGLALIEPAMDVLYNDCDAALAPELDKFMNPHALRAFETKPTAPAWADEAFSGRRAYVRTLNDCCNPVSLQDKWLEKSKVEWNVADLESGHMPFISQPEALAKQVVKFIHGFVTL
ncbi:hypothetical protein DL764_007172 [Monosporascus ibericus]|uniref:AB hydrolase-1 domain-containing protein n=1 Tax=Monosporascus ibericus TaxID=155417 RepID=A0A4Q4T510_9PEZI|nr:hypothetical protein DL764_007172 [Monosporascus ibericus]